MVERVKHPRSPNPIDELKDALQIDQDSLDDCLVEQPGHFFHVAEAYSLASSRRDEIKLRLSEVTAELDQEVRTNAARADEKITEGSIQTKLRTMPRIQALERELLAAKMEADNLLALKEAYQQRSFMLRELVALQLSQAHNLGVERGSVNARHQLGDRARERGEEARRAARASRE